MMNGKNVCQCFHLIAFVWYCCEASQAARQLAVHAYLQMLKCVRSTIMLREQ